MSEPKTIQANFRMPVDVLDWLDEYAAALARENGFSVSRTQALLRLIHISKAQESARLGM